MTLKEVTCVLLLLSIAPFSKGNDCPAEGGVFVSFSSKTFTVQESDMSVQLTLNLSRAIECCPVSVLLNCMNINANNGIDYECGSYGYIQAIFPTNSATTSFNISVKENIMTEGIKKFNVTIIPESLQYNVNVGDIQTATVNINDIPRLSFKESSYTVKENQGKLQLTLVLSNPSSHRIDVNIDNCSESYLNVSNIAQKGKDYNYKLDDYGKTISKGDINSSFDINIYDNDTDAFEGNETFALCIRKGTFMDTSVALVEPFVVIITIVDNEDNITVRFDQPEYTALTSPVLILSHIVPCPVTIYVSDKNITENTLEDFNSLEICSVTITNRAGNVSNSSCKIFANHNQSFELYIVKILLPYSFGLDDSSKTTIVDPAMVPAMVPDIAVDHNAINVDRGNVTLTLSWEEPSNNFYPIINYTVSCTGHITCPQTFTTTDNTTRSYTITNLITMTTYTFSVVATNSIGSGDAAVLNYTTPDKITFGKSTYVVKENQGVLEVSLNLTQPLSDNITVELIDAYFNSSGHTSCSSRVDYINGPYNVTFNAMSTRASFSVTICDDNEMESIETFGLYIRSLSPADMLQCLDIDNTTITITIVDDDDDNCPSMHFASPIYYFEERGFKWLKLILSEPFGVIAKMDLIYTSITATNESDYKIIENTATFQSGKTETSFCIKISYDTILEGNETFSVTAVPSSPTAKYFIHCNATTIVTLLDDDTIAINFGLPWYNWYHRPKRPQLKLHGAVSYNFTVEIYKKYRIAGREENCSFLVTIPLGQELPVRRCASRVRSYTLKINKSSLPSGVYEIYSKSTRVIEYW